ncbi:YheE family protein [Sutcliffiella halmapala]|uniref:YheE family protein n=1 Tax=Sutcliffiella halmapala TaxID=79882 RepID=UPI000994A397|nr:YheE family protein [Sutcliffiella halmapala]
MISHFQLKPLYKNNQLPGWHLSFFYKGQNLKAIYHKDGRIEWDPSFSYSDEDKQKIEIQIHELMLFHVYE